MIRVVVMASFLLLIGCVTASGPTKPNITYSGPYPERFSIIQQANPVLATELGKLPEIQDGIDAADEKALNTIVDLYQGNRTKFDQMFTEMYEEGRPEVRKYNSPLQAFYWILSDYDESYAKKLISKYSSKELLQFGWNFSKNARESWYRREVIKLRNTCKNERVCDKLPANINDYVSVIILAKRHPESFSYKFGSEEFPDFQKSYLRKQESRWGNFDVVADRLNSPELVSFYIKSGFSYRNNDLYASKKPLEVFEDKGGVCRHWAAFATYVLEIAGYDVKNVTATWGSGWSDGHTVTALKDGRGDYFILADSREPGKIKGPFGGYREIAKSFTQGNSIRRFYVEGNSRLYYRNLNAK